MTLASAQPPSGAQAFPARPTELSRIISLLRTRGAQLGAAPEMLVRIELALEELLVNTIQHGYLREDGLVWITLTPNANGIRLTYEDAAPPFNPCAIDAAALDRAHAGDDPERRPTGGLGRLLVARLCKANSYSYDSVRKRNVLSLDFSP